MKVTLDFYCYKKERLVRMNIINLSHSQRK